MIRGRPLLGLTRVDLFRPDKQRAASTCPTRHIFFCLFHAVNFSSMWDFLNSCAVDPNVFVGRPEALQSVQGSMFKVQRAGHSGKALLANLGQLSCLGKCRRMGTMRGCAESVIMSPGGTFTFSEFRKHANERAASGRGPLPWKQPITKTFSQRTTGFLTRFSVTNGRLCASQESIPPSSGRTLVIPLARSSSATRDHLRKRPRYPWAGASRRLKCFLLP